MSSHTPDTKKNTAAALILLAGATLSAAPAFAAGPQQKLEAHGSDFAFIFAFDRNELQSETGAANLLARLERQVQRNCRSSARIDANRRDIDACTNRTMEETVTKIQSPTLTTVLATKDKSNRTDG